MGKEWKLTLVRWNSIIKFNSYGTEIVFAINFKNNENELINKGH